MAIVVLRWRAFCRKHKDFSSLVQYKSEVEDELRRHYRETNCLEAEWEKLSVIKRV